MEATTYITFATFGTEYRLEEKPLVEDIRSCLTESRGSLVDIYLPSGPWDAIIVSDFNESQDVIKFRNALKSLGMWKVESVPSVSAAQYDRITKEKTHTTRR